MHLCPFIEVFHKCIQCVLIKMIPSPSSPILYFTTIFPFNITCLSFSLSLLSSVRAAHSWRSTGNSTDAWITNLGPHPWKKSLSYSSINCQYCFNKAWEWRAPLMSVLEICLASSNSGFVHAVKTSYLVHMCDSCFVHQFVFLNTPNTSGYYLWSF